MSLSATPHPCGSSSHLVEMRMYVGDGQRGGHAEWKRSITWAIGKKKNTPSEGTGMFYQGEK